MNKADIENVCTLAAHLACIQPNLAALAAVDSIR